MTGLPSVQDIERARMGRELELYAPPGLKNLDYSRGSYNAALTRMLARLQQSVAEDGGTPLADLNVLVEDDWSVALLHAGAAVTDVLSFYQERIINEGYLRTAIEDRSLFELGRTVGYELKPALGATTFLAFTVLTLKDEPPRRAIIRRSTAVQSVPRGTGQLPQIFETSRELVARSEWNALKPGPSGAPVLTVGPEASEIRLTGINIGVQPGAQILLLGSQKAPGDARFPWLVATVAAVQPNTEKGFTRVTWDVNEAQRGVYLAADRGADPPAGQSEDALSPADRRPLENPTCYLLQAPAALFGYTHGGIYTLVDVDGAPRFLPAAIGLPKIPVRSVVRNRRGVLFAATAKDVYRSTDGAESWRPAPVSAALKDITALAVLDDDRVLLAGAADGGLYLTKDEGDNWTAQAGDPITAPIKGVKWAVPPPSAPLPKTVVRSLLARAPGGREVIAGTDAGVLVSADRGRNWEPRNADLPQTDSKTGLSATPVWSVAASDSGDLYAATDAGVFRIRERVSLAPALIAGALVLLLAAVLALLTVDVIAFFPRLDSIPPVARLLGTLHIPLDSPSPLQVLIIAILVVAAVLLLVAALLFLARYAINRFLPAVVVVRQPVHALATGPDGRLYAALMPVAPQVVEPAAAAGQQSEVKLPSLTDKPPSVDTAGLLQKLAGWFAHLTGRGGAQPLSAKGAPAGIWAEKHAGTTVTWGGNPWAAFWRYLDLNPIPAWEGLPVDDGLIKDASLSTLGWDQEGGLLAGTLDGRLYQLPNGASEWTPLTGADGTAGIIPTTRTVAVDPALSGSGAGQPAGVDTLTPGAVSAAPGAGNEPSTVNPAGSGEGTARTGPLPLKAVAALGSRSPIPGALVAAGEPADAKQESGWSPAHLAHGWLDMDKIYPGVSKDNWLVLRQRQAPAGAHYAELYKVEQAQLADSLDAIRPDRLTRLTVSPAAGLSSFDRQTTSVLAQGVELKFFDDHAVQGDSLILDRFVPDLEPGKVLIVSGKRMRARRPLGKPSVVLTAADGTNLEVVAGESLQVVSKQAGLPGDQVRWRLAHRTGFAGTVDVEKNGFILQGALAEDETVAEDVRVKRAGYWEDGPGHLDPDHTRLDFDRDLANLYDRTTVVVYANVVDATQGDTVEGEILGSSDSMSTNQAFRLHEGPLTYLPTSAEGGMINTLEVRVNNLKWEEVPALYGLAPGRRAYMVRRDFVGNTNVIFGDSRSGAGVARGTSRIEARYRRGSGSTGNVDAASLTVLQTAVTDIKEVVNPMAAQGGTDAEVAAQARVNAPRKVRALDRVISLTDIEDYALTLAGIAKAKVQVVREDGVVRYRLTVAGQGGGLLGQAECDRIAGAIDGARSAPDLVPLEVVDYFPVSFRIHAMLRIVDPGLASDARQHLLDNGKAALRDALAFDRRDLDQPVTVSEIIATLQAIPGIIAAEQVGLTSPAGDTSVISQILPATAPRPGSRSQLLQPDETPKGISLEIIP